MENSESVENEYACKNLNEHTMVNTSVEFERRSVVSTAAAAFGFSHIP